MLRKGTKLNARARQTFPYPALSQPFPYSNVLMAKSLPFKRVTDKQKWKS